ncbi:prolyl oligopeptidase family serine peptidase [Riemerella columbina]|uniref:carboxylesterase family protein n=1 Tax=Riemerella columbina TaxID=103810 RepID=UPI00266EFA59|nr:prolyl oligopeptidase family serine peptidase [Riemerella columbina]WKS94878.1 prolyl oligopeptidase family serine peptidase [Riemerella columbina]
MKKLILYFTISLLCGGWTSAQEKKLKYEGTAKRNIAINYVLDIPKEVAKPFPLIVFLHGAGERGDDLERVKVHSPFTYRHLMKEPVAILAPQCPQGEYWDTEAVYELLKTIISQYPVDQNRIYLTGLSMGGWGTWKLADEHPELFAAIAPVCAPMHRPAFFNACEHFRDTPIWLFHGALDDVVPLDDSTRMFKKLKNCNPKVQYTIFEKDNHNAWDSTYSMPTLYEWILSQRKP